MAEFDESELRQFAAWFAEFEQQVWDRQMEEDSNSGRLDFLHEEAQRERAEGSLRDL